VIVNDTFILLNVLIRVFLFINDIEQLNNFNMSCFRTLYKRLVSFGRCVV